MRHFLHIANGETVLLNNEGGIEPASVFLWKPVTRESLERGDAIVIRLTAPFEIELTPKPPAPTESR